MGCLPAKPIPLPFGAVISPPHFLWSPPEVWTFIWMSYKWLSLGLPNPGTEPRWEEAWSSAIFNKSYYRIYGRCIFPVNVQHSSIQGQLFCVRIEKTCTRENLCDFRFSSTLTSLIHPTFWMEINIEMRHYAISYLKTNTVTIPAAILGVGISLIVIFVSIFFCLDDKLLRVSSIFSDSKRLF